MDIYKNIRISLKTFHNGQITDETDNDNQLLKDLGASVQIQVAVTITWCVYYVRVILPGLKYIKVRYKLKTCYNFLKPGCFVYNNGKTISVSR